LGPLVIVVFVAFELDPFMYIHLITSFLW